MGFRYQLTQLSAFDRQAPTPSVPPKPAHVLDGAPTGRRFGGNRSALGVSVIGHIAVLSFGLMFAGANPFATIPPDAIAVDIVSPDEVGAPDPLGPVAPKSETPPPSQDLSFSDSVPTPPAAPNTPAAHPAPRQVAPERPPVVKPATRQAAAKPQEFTPRAPISPLQYPQSQQLAVTPPEQQQPNFTDVFGLPVTLPGGHLGGGFDAPAYDAAKISADETAAFRNHIKSCGGLSATVSPNDKVRIVLRVALSPDGMLAGDPTLIEASATAKGPLLMKNALEALRRCQPYTMLPPDRYEEWKVLDLTFTPRDLAG